MFIVIETSDNTDPQAYGPFNTEAEATKYKTNLWDAWHPDSKESHNVQMIVQMIRQPFANC